MHVQFIDQAEQLVDQANCFAFLKYTILDKREIVWQMKNQISFHEALIFELCVISTGTNMFRWRLREGGRFSWLHYSILCDGILTGSIKEKGDCKPESAGTCHVTVDMVYI